MDKDLKVQKIGGQSIRRDEIGWIEGGLYTGVSVVVGGVEKKASGF